MKLRLFMCWMAWGAVLLCAVGFRLMYLDGQVLNTLGFFFVGVLMFFMAIGATVNVFTFARREKRDSYEEPTQVVHPEAAFVYKGRVEPVIDGLAGYDSWS